MKIRLLLFSLLFALTSATAAVAQERGRFGAFLEAADRLDRLAAAASARNGPPPRATDPEVATLLRVINDTPSSSFQGLGPDDQEELQAVANRGLGITLLYTQWPEAGDTGAGARDGATTRNFVRYQQELAPLWAFVIESVGELVRVRTEQARLRASEGLTEAQRGGLTRMRNGSLEFIEGFLNVLAIPGLDPGRRQAMLDAFARRAGQFAGILTLSQRRRMGLMIRMRRPADAGPQASAALDRAERAFSSSACTGLCAL